MAAKARKKSGKPAGTSAGDVLSKIRSGFKGKVKPLSELDRIEVIPTGLEVLDNWIFQIGGAPVGRVMEVFSDPDVGKTSLGLHLIGAAQRAGGIGTLVEAENTIDKTRAPIMGADPEQILLFEQDSMENFLLNMRLALERIPDGFGPNVLVYDSLAASSLEKQLASIASKEPSKQKLTSVVGGKARLMSAELPVLASLARKKRAHICIINQTREQIGVMFGDPTTTPGGKVTKFQSSIRLRMWRGKQYKRAGVDVGHPVTIKCMKSKFSRGNQSAKFRLDYEHGWDNDWALIDFAREHDLLPEKAKVTAENLEIARAGVLTVPDWYKG